MSELNYEVKKTLEVLKKGGIILYPTDTVWGLGCDATNADAVKRINRLKKREAGKNFILLLENDSRLASYVKEIPETAWLLIEYTTRPLTIIYDAAKNLPEEVIAADGTIAIRVVKDEFCQKLIQALKKPLVSTSANVSGSPFPSAYEEISDEIKSGVDYVVNWRRNEKSPAVPSVIIKLKSNGEISFIRR
jgi:L-threonylcarbamoyladenylate synthase